MTNDNQSWMVVAAVTDRISDARAAELADLGWMTLGPPTDGPGAEESTTMFHLPPEDFTVDTLVSIAEAIRALRHVSFLRFETELTDVADVAEVVDHANERLDAS